MRSGTAASPKKCRVRPMAQGDLDYMCAMYSIINALRALCPEIDEKVSVRLFRFLLRRLGDHTKHVLISLTLGTDSSLLRKLLGEAQAYVRKRLKIELVVYTKGKEIKTKSLGIAWTCLEKALDDKTVAILPLGGRCNHWTVLYDVRPRKLRLIDSGYRRKLARSRCTLRATEKRYKLQLSGLITISRTT